MKRSQISIYIFNCVRFILGTKVTHYLLFVCCYKRHYRKSKCLFVHIPKAAGTSIAKTLYGKRVGHFSASQLRNFLPAVAFSDRLKFAVVRNPYDRLISAYSYAIQGGTEEGGVNNLSKYRQNAFRTFSSFVKEWLVYQDLETIELIFRPQYLFLYEGDLLLVDFVGKVESIKEVEQWLSERTNHPVKLQYSNRSQRRKEWRDMLDDELAAIIYKLYARDFIKFQYSSQWK